MRTLVETLLEAQNALKAHRPGTPGWNAIVESLRGAVPEPILAHFLRLVTNGSRAVALVNHGVCSNCHIRVPFGVMAALRNPKDVHLCDQCGSYLLIPAEEIRGLAEVKVLAPVRRGRRPAAALVL